MSFSQRLRELRESKKLTQGQLADAAGMSKGGIANLEQGIREPTWATLQKLAGALGVGVDAFTEPTTKDMKPRGRGRPPKAKAAKPAKKRK